MGEGELSPAGRPRLATRLRRPWSRVVLVATTLAFVLLSTGLIAVFSATPAQAHSSTVTVLDGQLLVRHGSGEFAAVVDGETVTAGDTVRTAAGSHGVLTLFDGSTVELEPDTEITVDALASTRSGDKIIEMTQAIGRTWHVVTHLTSSSSRYEIHTGASTAAVRGTAFEVSVAPDGSTNTNTTDGDVATSAQGAEVHVLPGQMTTVTQGSPPPPPQAVPEAAATVTITVDRTQNAIVTDANGRAVGVQNGLPVRYIPGSKVAVADGKLVLTIPNAELGVLSTFVKPDAVPPGSSAPTDVTVQTQVAVKDVGIVANSLTTQPVENGAAKGAVVVTDRGLLLVPNSDAKNAPAPHIGKAPAEPAGIPPVMPAQGGASLASLAPATPSPALSRATLPAAPRSSADRNTAAPTMRTAPVAPTNAPISDAPRVAVVPATAGARAVPAAPTDGAPKPLDLTSAAFQPFRSGTTPAATNAGELAVAVNSGVVAVTAPVASLFTVARPDSPATPSTEVGALTAAPAKTVIDPAAVTSILALIGNGALSGAPSGSAKTVIVAKLASDDGQPADSRPAPKPDLTPALPRPNTRPAVPAGNGPPTNRFAPNLAPVPCVPTHRHACP